MQSRGRRDVSSLVRCSRVQPCLLPPALFSPPGVFPAGSGAGGEFFWGVLRGSAGVVSALYVTSLRAETNRQEVE